MKSRISKLSTTYSKAKIIVFGHSFPSYTKNDELQVVKLIDSDANDTKISAPLGIRENMLITQTKGLFLLSLGKSLWTLHKGTIFNEILPEGIFPKDVGFSRGLFPPGDFYQGAFPLETLRKVSLTSATEVYGW